MKVSVITVVHNNEKNIKGCMESVNFQVYDNIEHIIIDGKSTDNTLQIIKENKNPRIKLVSEKDSGIYDAMNKGIQLSSGQIVGFLNSDDLFYDKNAIENIVKVFKEENVDSCYGDLVYVDKDNTEKIIRYWKSNDFRISLFKKGWHPPHPTFYVKKEIFEKYGFFDLKYKIAADYALMLKLLLKEKISTFYIPEVIVKMRVGGTSNNSINNIILANYECYRAWKDMDIDVSPMLVIRKPFGKIFQYFQ